MGFAERLKEARLKQGFSKIELSEKADVHHVQIGRYENKGAHPSAEVLGKLANALGVSTEYLLNGEKEDISENTLQDKDLLNQFKTIEAFSDEKKKVVKELLNAFIITTKLQQQLAS